jgi:hypothetical protein
LKVVDDSAVASAPLKESSSSSSLRKSRATSVSIPLEVPLRASSPELPILGGKDDSTSPKRSSLLASSKSNNLVPAPSSSSVSAPEDDDEIEIEYPRPVLFFPASVPLNHP